MKRFYPYLASLALLVATAAGAYVIKDTANPVDIYTGSNTTPTIRAATSGAVTLGVTAGSGLQHTVQSNGGTEFAVKSNSATGSVYMSLNPQTNTPKAFIGVNGASGDLGAGTGGAGDFVIRTESEPIQFSLNSGATNHGNIATSGAWTLGASSGQTASHFIRAGTASNTPILDLLQTGSGNASMRFNPGGASDGGDFLIAGSGGYHWKNSSNTEVASLSNAGLLTVSSLLSTVIRSNWTDQDADGAINPNNSLFTRITAVSNSNSSLENADNDGQLSIIYNTHTTTINLSVAISVGNTTISMPQNTLCIFAYRSGTGWIQLVAPITAS